MTSFTVVDFETCAYQRASACAVGAVRVADGQVADSFYTLLRPPERPYWNFVEIHGITPEMVADAPTFPEVWPRLKALLGRGPFVAHNAPFDWGVLRQTLAHYQMEPIELTTICTCQLARRSLPQLRCHTLAAVTEHLGISLNHHHAASDAQACAEIAIQLWSR